MVGRHSWLMSGDDAFMEWDQGMGPSASPGLSSLGLGTVCC